MTDESFLPDRPGLELALEALLTAQNGDAGQPLPSELPEQGVGEMAALRQLAPHVIGRAARLGGDTAFAHMDPPTPWITWATSLWNASLNQNLLHPSLSPVARDVEQRVIEWIAPTVGMNGGHLTPGSTIANLTALWAARERHGVRRVVASTAAHLSVQKSAHILGLEYCPVDTDDQGRLAADRLPKSLADAALVLTAGTTSAGAIDPLASRPGAAWIHVDAAWAGPLRFSKAQGYRLDGIEAADSVAISAHKWLFQPKESGLVLFRDANAAHASISFGGEYLDTPNVGVLGSHGASAVSLYATLLAWGRSGLEERIDRSMALADRLADWLGAQPGVTLFGPNVSGVVLWRAKPSAEIIITRLPPGAASTTTIDGTEWIRHVAANPNVDMDALKASVLAAISD